MTRPALSRETFRDGRLELIGGDCLDAMDAMAADGFDAVVTDPPYHLTSIVKRFGPDGAAPAMSAAQRRFAATGGADRAPGSDQFGRLSTGFMGQRWDGGDIAFRPETWARAMRVLKPGGHLIAFAAPKNFDLMTAAIRAAGFEMRDTIFDLFSLSDLERRFVDSLDPAQAEALARVLDHRAHFGPLAWAFGSGFPKSHDVSKGIDNAAGAKRERIAVGPPVKRMIPGADQARDGWEKTSGRDYQPGVEIAATEAAREWAGWGTALKPAIEPICLARKPLSEGSVAANVLRHGTGAVNVDGCRVEAESDRPYCTTPSAGGVVLRGRLDGSLGHSIEDRSALGRWPANLVHDGSADVVGAFPVTGAASRGVKQASKRSTAAYGDFAGRGDVVGCDDADGSVARFFYSAKADAADRLGSKHPTVKPLALMRWLVRLVTPPGGRILDPFAGTGSTGIAAICEGFSATLVERESAYRDDIRRRIAALDIGASERAALTVPQDDDLGPLFAEAAT
ncbi:MAG: RsmD family RNA methyltransferase [Hyphomicrobiales bacterium]|nr:RsmD family RNA methyltransferase [Hyphomicrobiales bacterium]